MQKPKLHFTTPNGGGGVRFFERRETPPQPPFVPPGHVAFRLLCHASRVGGVIGKSGSIVKQLQHETSAKIRIEDSLPSPDDRRVIFIIASAVVDKKIKLSASKRATFREEEEEGGNSHDEEVVEVEVSLAQEATVRVFERVIEVAAETDGFGTVAGGLTSCRLLAAPNQVGSVIGKGGSVIDKIRNDTGCRIKALKVDKIWNSPSFTDEVIEIEGDLLGVKRAIVAVTHCLQDCPPNVGRTWVSSSRHFEAVPLQNAYDLPDELPSRRAPFVRSAAAAPSGFALNGRHFSVGDERISTTASRMPQQEVAFKILCPNDRVGSIIGPGGSIVKSIQADTGASIKVDPPVATCDVRGVTISAMENLNLQQSIAQNATMIVFRRFADACPEIDSVSGLVGSQISVGLVVPSNQVGCLLGKGGAIVSGMRKTTATGIQIHTSDQVRPCILENEEVVQITGKFANVQDALYKVMTRLRDNLVATKLFSPNTDKSPYGRTNDPFQLGFSLPAGVSHQLTHRMDNLRLSQSEHRLQSTRPWTSQAQNGVNGKEDGGWTSPKNGVELGRSVIVTNTTIEIAVPEEVVESVCGENGSNLDRLRQISGAKVVMHEPEAGKAERTIVLSGSREETLAAQSLLQAFII